MLLEKGGLLLKLRNKQLKKKKNSQTTENRFLSQYAKWQSPRNTNMENIRPRAALADLLAIGLRTSCRERVLQFNATVSESNGFCCPSTQDLPIAAPRSLQTHATAPWEAFTCMVSDKNCTRLLKFEDFPYSMEVIKFDNLSRECCMLQRKSQYVTIAGKTPRHMSMRGQKMDTDLFSESPVCFLQSSNVRASLPSLFPHFVQLLRKCPGLFFIAVIKNHTGPKETWRGKDCLA